MLTGPERNFIRATNLSSEGSITFFCYGFLNDFGTSSALRRIFF